MLLGSTLGAPARSLAPRAARLLPELRHPGPDEPPHEGRGERGCEREADRPLRGLVSLELGRKGLTDRGRHRVESHVALPGGVPDQRTAPEPEGWDPVAERVNGAG